MYAEDKPLSIEKQNHVASLSKHQLPVGRSSRRTCCTPRPTIEYVILGDKENMKGKVGVGGRTPKDRIPGGECDIFSRRPRSCPLLKKDWPKGRWAEEYLRRPLCWWCPLTMLLRRAKTKNKSHRGFWRTAPPADVNRSQNIVDH